MLPVNRLVASMTLLQHMVMFSTIVGSQPYICHFHKQQMCVYITSSRVALVQVDVNTIFRLCFEQCKACSCLGAVAAAARYQDYSSPSSALCNVLLLHSH